MRRMKEAAVFLDRDGTINEEVGYLDNLARLVIYPQAPEAIKVINDSGMKAIVATNQSGVARGYFAEAFVMEVHGAIQEALAKDQAHLDALYYCPHYPEGRGIYRCSCQCRKPAPGMLLQAAQDMGLDLGRSYLVGDTEKDMAAAQAAGVKGVLVRTGYGRETEAGIVPGDGSPCHVAGDLLAAVVWIMQDRAR